MIKLKENGSVIFVNPEVIESVETCDEPVAVVVNLKNGRAIQETYGNRKVRDLALSCIVEDLESRECHPTVSGKKLEEMEAEIRRLSDTVKLLFDKK